MITISPIGIFGLIAKLIITTGSSAFIPLLKYIAIVIIGLAIHALIVLPTILKQFIALFITAKDVFTSLTTGFTTASSAATYQWKMQKRSKFQTKYPVLFCLWELH